MCCRQSVPRHVCCIAARMVLACTSAIDVLLLPLATLVPQCVFRIMWLQEVLCPLLLSTPLGVGTVCTDRLWHHVGYVARVTRAGCCWLVYYQPADVAFAGKHVRQTIDGGCHPGAQYMPVTRPVYMPVKAQQHQKPWQHCYSLTLQQHGIISVPCTCSMVDQQQGRPKCPAVMKHQSQPHVA